MVLTHRIFLQKPNLLDTGVFSALETQAAGHGRLLTGTPAWSGHRHLLSKVTAANWAELKIKCEAGGNEVTLSDSFDASSYSGQIDFSGKTCVVKGQGQTLDAKGAGRFFYGYGAGSSLEVHGLVLKNGKASVRGCVQVSRKFLNFLSCLSNNRRSVNSARIILKLCAVGTSGC